MCADTGCAVDILVGVGGLVQGWVSGLEFPEVTMRVKCSNPAALCVLGCMLTHKMSRRWICSNLLLRVSAQHYSTGSQDLEGVQTAASAHALHQPMITSLGISIIWN